jgi:outer membrane protein OmpU
MKKVLLTTTALVMTAGVAAAEITFSGTGGIALVDDNGAQAAAGKDAAGLGAALEAALTAQANAAIALADAQAKDAAASTAATQKAVTAAQTALATADGKVDTAVANTASGAAALAAREAARAANSDMRIVSYYDMDVTATASTEMGIDFALGFDMGAGEKVDYDDDDMVEVQGVDVGDADVSATYAGWTLAVDQNGIDNAYTDDAAEQDMSLSGSIGGIALTVTADLEADHNSFNASYTTGDITATVSGTNDDEGNGDASAFSVAYKLGDLSMKYSSADESNNAEDDQSINFTYAMDAITLSYTTIAPGKDGDFGDEWDAKVSYAAGAMSASLNIDEADATTMIAEYDLGGATAFAAMHDKAGTNSDLTVFGVNFAF